MIKMYLVEMGDNQLPIFERMLDNEPNLIVFARGSGRINNLNNYNLYNDGQDMTILTNDEYMLDYVDLFNGRPTDPDLYVWDKDYERWFSVKVDCKKEIRQAHNLIRLLVTHEFNF